jgi:hypothetical protein
VRKFNDVILAEDMDLYDLEDILKELKELEANNNFHEGDIISKSSKTRVKRKSGRYQN